MQSKDTLLKSIKEVEGVIQIHFPYSQETLELVRNIPGRKYNADKKFWTCPLAAENIYLLGTSGFIVTKELRTYYKKNKPQPQKELELNEDPNSPYRLRKYQKQAIAKGLLFVQDIKQKSPGVIVLPTGAGKSIVIAEIARRTRKRTIVLQPSKELLEQNYDKYVGYGERASIYSASMGTKEVGEVTFAMIGSIVNKPELFADFDLCIIDECHLVSPEPGTMYEKFLNGLEIKTLGLTATPVRMKAYGFPHPHVKACMLDRMRPRYFAHYIHITQISELVRDGYWTPLRYKRVSFDNTMLKLNSTGRDYTVESLLEAWIQNKTFNYIKKVMSHPEINHILVFVPSVETGRKLLETTSNTELLYSGLDKDERIRIVKEFKEGKIRCVINVNILSIGFDFPKLDCIVLARPTKSLLLYYQQIGRGVRVHNEKKFCWIFDLVGNTEKFGRVEDLEIKRDNGLMNVISNGRVLSNIDLTAEEDRVPIIPNGKYRGVRVNKLKKEIIEEYLKGKPRNKIFLPIFNYLES